MNKNIVIANNKNENDIFTNMQIPAYDENNSVTTSATTQPNNISVEADANIIIVAGILIALIILLVIIARMLKPAKQVSTNKQIRPTIKKQRIREEVQEVPKPQVIQTKKQKETGDFATPKNLDKCIRLFLENTRIK